MADLETRITTLPSGVRIVTEAMPSVRSVSLGCWIGTGSRGESHEQAGLSHLIEHLLFKGSSRYSSLDIDQIFESMGTDLSAGTSRESTVVSARVIDQHLKDAFDVMSDMIWSPAFSDIDSEREVILEEIAMYEDDPQDKVFDLLGSAIFGDHPLGRSIIGRAEVIADTPVDQIRAFHADRYVPCNVVIAAAGAVDHDMLVELTEARAPHDVAGSAPGYQPAPGGTLAGVRFERRKTEQYHVCLGGVGIAQDDERRFALRVLDTIFGATSSSRLFQEVREQRGLAYAVSSFTGQFADTGQVGLYLGTRGENLAQAMQVVADELHRLVEHSVTPQELSRAKKHLKGRMILALESTGARMNRIGSHLLAGVPLLDLDEVTDRIDAVTREELVTLAQTLYPAQRLCAAGIGPDEDAFRSALGPISTAVAA